MSGPEKNKKNDMQILKYKKIILIQLFTIRTT